MVTEIQSVVVTYTEPDKQDAERHRRTAADLQVTGILAAAERAASEEPEPEESE